MTPADITLVRALIRDVRAHFDGRGISGPMALRLADACEMLLRDHMQVEPGRTGLNADGPIRHSTRRGTSTLTAPRVTLPSLCGAAFVFQETWKLASSRCTRANRRNHDDPRRTSCPRAAPALRVS